MSTKSLKIVVAAIAVLATAVALIYQAQGPLEQGDNSQKRHAITIAQAGDFYLYAPIYIAADKGFFKARGLDVTVVSTGGDEKTWAAVISGSAQFGVADPTFIAIASQRGQPGRIVSTIVNGVPFWGITKNPAIKTVHQPSDLRGYTVATFPSPSTAYALQRRMFEMGGLAPKIREGAFGTLLSLLEAGQADIALELEPNVSQALASSGYRIVYSLSDLYGDYTITGLTTTPAFIQNDRDSVKNVVSAIQDALTFLHQNPEDSTKILAKRFPEINRDVAKSALQRVLAAGIIPKQTIVVESAWRKALQTRVDAGDVKMPDNIMKYVDNSFANQ